MAANSNSKSPGVCECGSHAWAPLTRGYVALVDPSDIDALFVSHHMAPSRHKPYARSGDGVYLHQRLMGMEKGVDHINGDGLDNRRKNLRSCSAQQNVANRRKSLGKSSRFKGVCKYRTGWRAVIRHGKPIWLGVYSTEVEAAKVYDAAATELFGEFALTNGAMGLY